MAWSLPGLRRACTEKPNIRIQHARSGGVAFQGMSAHICSNHHHGACHIYEINGWLQALYFDIRKGAHSIGSNVRDAAAYVLWALARTQDSATLTPHAANLANRLASVAIYDREIHIRRAASAAYQEHVGRMVSGLWTTAILSKHSLQQS